MLTTTTPPVGERRLSALMFTDLVGSVALQQRLGTAAYLHYVARHDEVFQAALAHAPGARVLNETGDGFLVRFDDTGDALNAALRLQWLLHRETCEGERMRVRIGLHLGVVTEMEERIRGERRVVGMPVNLTARIMDLADGGQILMTRAFYEDARHHVRAYPDIPGIDSLPELRWVAHGLYEFKGSPEPMEIFEAGGEGIGSFLPPESAGKARRHERPARPDRTPADAQGQSTEEMRESDVYIAHAPVDDSPLLPGREGWVTQFHRNLEVRLEQLLGEPVKVWRDTGPRDPDRLQAILGHLPNIKAMISVLSPPFVKSEHCLREVAEFGRTDESRSRLVKAEKTPLDSEDIPPELHPLLSLSTPFPFYEVDQESGRVLEYDASYNEAARQRFFERVYDVAYELKRVLKSKSAPRSGETSDRPAPGPTGNGKTIFLAETTSDLRPARDQLRRELLEAGHRVLPEHALPLTGAALEEALERNLAEADLSVHMVGDRYGVVPEDSSYSLVELQNLAAARMHDARGFPRILWSPRDLEARDDRQAAFLRRIIEEPSAHRGAEVIQDTLENLSSIILRSLAPKPSQADVPSGNPPAPDRPPTVYLIYDRRDEEAVEPLEDLLFDQGFEVITPHFEGDEAEVSHMHRQNLLRCDAVLVYYGLGSRTWVEMQMMDVVQAPGYGRSQPMRAQTVLVAPPEDRRKARFRTHLGEVIRQEGEELHSDALAAFTSRLRTAEGKDA